MNWIKRYILFHGKRHPVSMGKEEVEVFLTHLAASARWPPRPRIRPLSAILFVYKEVLGREIKWLDNVQRQNARPGCRLVLTEAEIRALLGQLEGRHWLMASFLYGAGLRLMECVCLRVKDIDFGYTQITVRDGAVTGYLSPLLHFLLNS